MSSRGSKFALILFLLITSVALGATQNINVGMGFTFDPADVTINAGDTVQWNWIASGHSTTSTTAVGGCVTGGTDPWDSGIQMMGATFNKTFSTAGVYSYKCTPHCGMNMRGVIRVVDFDITCSPLSISAAANGSGQSTCTITSVNNFNSAVDLSVTGLPAGVTFMLSADPVVPPAGGTITSTLTLNVGAAVASGSYPFTLSGQNGDRIKSVNMALNVPLFIDDFSDGDVTDWTFTKGTWNVVSGSLVGTHNKKASGFPPYQMAPFTSVETVIQTTGGTGALTSVFGWFINKQNNVEVMMKEEKNRWVVKQRLNGNVVAKGKAVMTIDPNTEYRVKIKHDQPTNTLQLFIDNVLVLTLNASSPGTGAPALGVKGTTSTFAEIIVF